MTSPTRADLESALSAVQSRRLLGIGRAADMACFTFGTAGQKPLDVLLHVQCPWRLEREGRVLTGRSDLWEPENPDDPAWLQAPGDYERYANLQDARLKGFHEILESSAEIGLVTGIRVDPTGGFDLDLTGGFRISVFPASSRSECWRIFKRGGGHFVVPPEE